MDDATLTQLIDATRDSRPTGDMQLAARVKPIIDHMLGDGMSVIDPEAKIWTAEVAEELRSCIEDNLDYSDTDQWTKFKEQLDGAPREVVLLAAEIVFLREHPVKDAKASTRRRHIMQVLSVLSDPPELPAIYEDCFTHSGEHGFRAGQGYYSYAYKDVVWVANFVKRYRQAVPAGTQRPDPWALQDIMQSTTPLIPKMRNMLQFLAAPEAFECIASSRLKHDIANAPLFASYLSKCHLDTNSPQGRDQALLQIRAELFKEFQNKFHFWTENIQELWRRQCHTL
ncbi:hypothetical protein C1Y63_09700 [Corynebacterium sp. 13CS0277]|uniref:hypothetical protein n=1 Tax=Corynebacterium sp. 13CS0277 TaxID=2071994 RepID=UPI000D022465|nr:hypothetical protein [Corynebacterium sp. 13CS0277]PRQ10807.1 hypothetical protein C1Y63_09700 [Corynebacterium sp. 13CS0277]